MCCCDCDRDRPFSRPTLAASPRCDPCTTAAACPRSRSYPGPRPPPPKSRCRSVDDRLPRDPWHPSVPRCEPPARLPPTPAPDPTPAAATEVPPPFRGRSVRWASTGTENLLLPPLLSPLPVMIERTSASDGRTRRDLHRSSPAAVTRNRRAQSFFEPAGPSWRASYYI